MTRTLQKPGDSVKDPPGALGSSSSPFEAQMRIISPRERLGGPGSEGAAMARGLL